MKQRHEASIYLRRDVWAFVKIAPVAGERKVRLVVASPVLPGDDVFDVERNEREFILVAPTILAPVASTSSHVSSECSIDRHSRQAAPSVEMILRAFACRTPRKLIARTQVSYSARSSPESTPSLDFSASWSIRS